MGAGVAVDAVLGQDFGVENKVNYTGSIIDSAKKILMKTSFVGELDFNWTKSTSKQAGSGMGDNEVGATANVLAIVGGQMSHDLKGNQTGFGVKLGIGMGRQKSIGGNASFNINYSLLSAGVDSTDGGYFQTAVGGSEK